MDEHRIDRKAAAHLFRFAILWRNVDDQPLAALGENVVKEAVQLTRQLLMERELIVRLGVA